MSKNDKNKNLGVVIVVGLVLLLVGAFMYLKWQEYEKYSNINTYEECVAAGYPILESYPPQCRANSKLFAQDVGNELEYTDEIQIASPRPNEKVRTPLKIIGKARGSWFFEGILNAEIYDLTNKRLGQAILTARGEWMTEEFVEFQGEIDLARPENPKGRLVIKNANPSGLEENQKELIIPIVFE